MVTASEQSCFLMIFQWWWAAWTMCIMPNVMTIKFRLYSKISQMLLIFKTWGYYNNLNSVTLSQCECMEHGLKGMAFYVKKNIY